MRPGVPWNVKGIEAEAREVAQQAARRAGVSLGEYLSGLILTEGRAAPGGAYPQQQGDGTYGPQPQYRPQPAPQSYAQQQGPRYPQAAGPSYPEPNYPPPSFGPAAALAAAYPQPQAYAQGAPEYAPRRPELLRPQAQPGYGPGETAYRPQDVDVFSMTLRELGDRVEQSEQRAQQAIQNVNQSVASMQERLDAAERVKQLADAAFSSAADALAQSARDQSKAFDSLETSVRNVQQRLSDIEAGQAEWPGRESFGRLEVALGQLQRRLGDLDAERDSLPSRDTVLRLETAVQQLQKRLGDMEAASGNSPDKAALARLEASISSMRNEAMDTDRRTREDMTHMAKYMRDLGGRVETVERNSLSGDGLGARFDALEARSTSMFDEIRGQMSAMDARIAQATSPSNTISPSAFAALKGSVEGIASRLEEMGNPTSQPLAKSISAIETTLGALTSKIEESDARTAESVGTVNAVLRSLTNRFDDADKRQSQAINALTSRIDESDERAEAGARELSDAVDRALGDFGQRLEVADKANKNSIAAVRMTVDGLVARAAERAVPLEQESPRQTQVDAALDAVRGSFREASPGLPPFVSGHAATQDRSFPTDLPPFIDDLPREGGADARALGGDGAFNPSTLPPLADTPQDAGSAAPITNVIEQARRAARAAAQANEDKPAARRSGAANATPAAQQQGGSSLVRRGIVGLAVVAVVVGLVAIFFMFFGTSDQPAPESSVSGAVDDIVNPPVEASTPAPSAAGANPAGAVPPVADVPADGIASPDASLVPPGEGGAPAEGAGAAVTPSDFISGTSALPERSKKETEVAILEAASARGEARAQFLLSLRYAEGRGVPKDDTVAASLASKAAEQGLAVAQYRLGMLLERGVGIEKSVPQAKQWYERAAKLGHRKAMHNLAVLHADATVGSPNYREAVRWFREGASYGVTDSQYNLAVLLEQGMGVEKNLKEALTWYKVAAEQGDTGAAERLDVLQKTMPPADVALAIDAARKFKARPTNPTVNEAPSMP